MKREEYNACVSAALSGKRFSGPERKKEFCIAAKECSGKASSRADAEQMCALSASQPKEPKGRKRRASTGGGGMELVLITTTGCKPCSVAKQYLQERIDKGEIRVVDVQKDNWAADLCAKNHIVSVPKLLVIDSEGNPFSEVQVTDTEEMI